MIGSIFADAMPTEIDQKDIMAFRNARRHYGRLQSNESAVPFASLALRVAPETFTCFLITNSHVLRVPTAWFHKQNCKATIR